MLILRCQEQFKEIIIVSDGFDTIDIYSKLWVKKSVWFVLDLNTRVNHRSKEWRRLFYVSSQVPVHSGTTDRWVTVKRWEE